VAPVRLSAAPGNSVGGDAGGRAKHTGLVHAVGVAMVQQPAAVQLLLTPVAGPWNASALA
jgi:hypothetical protein